jgi:hypothetical protein
VDGRGGTPLTTSILSLTRTVCSTCTSLATAIYLSLSRWVVSKSCQREEGGLPQDRSEATEDEDIVRSGYRPSHQYVWWKIHRRRRQVWKTLRCDHGEGTKEDVSSHPSFYSDVLASARQARPPEPRFVVSVRASHNGRAGLSPFLTPLSQVPSA